MRYRKLRIAWSVGWGVVAMLLIGLWVHTLHRQVRLEGWVSHSHYLATVALHHWIAIEPTSYVIGPPGTWYPPAAFQDNPVNRQQEATASPARGWRCVTYRDSQLARLNLTVPFWFPIVLSTAIGMLSWIVPVDAMKRFSLRTLLIATTLVAVVLGLIVWGTR